MENQSKRNKLPFMTKVGYGSGTAGDSMPYTLFFTYFIFFMTDIAGIDPGIAGTISFLAIVSQAISGPIFGYLTDNSVNPKGRRRPFMMRVLIPFMIFIAFMFFPVNLTGTVQWVYYLVMAIGMWTCYSAYKGPWDALGAELTDDYNERNMIRFSTGVWAYPFNWVAQSFVLIVVGVFAAKGAIGMGWFWGVVVCAALTGIFGVVACQTTKGRENMSYLEHAEETKAKKKGIVDLFKGYFEFLKVKAIRTLVIFMFVFLIGYTVVMNGLVYVLSYNAGLNEGQQATFWTLNTVICIVLLPVVTAVANKIDKKVAIATFILISVILNVIFFITGVNNMAAALVFSLGGALTTTAFYGVFYSLLYDCCDVYELVSGERKEGGLMAMALLAQTLGSAFASLVFGWLMQAIHYDGASIPDAGQMQGILAINTIIPAILMLIAMFLLFRYKMTESMFNKVKQAIQDKKDGKEVDMTQFKDII